MAGVKPRDSLALARLIRAVTVARYLGCRPDDVLDAKDLRTVVGLLRRGGLRGSSLNNGTVTLTALLERQSLEPPGPALSALYETLYGANAPVLPNAD